MDPKRPKLVAPPGACDTHMHFYDESAPSAPGGPPLPGNFTVPMYQELQKRLKDAHRGIRGPAWREAEHQPDRPGW